MHNNVRSSARNWYVALAFILIIIALILAGCVGLDRQPAAHSLGCGRDPSHNECTAAFTSGVRP